MNDIYHFSFLIENAEITLYYTLSQFVSFNDGLSYPHQHPMHEMFILVDGELYIESDFSIISLKSSDICIIPPLTYHSTYRKENVPTKRISMLFTYKKNEMIETDLDFYSFLCSLSKKGASPINLSADTVIIDNLVQLLLSVHSQNIPKLKEVKIKNILSLLFINFAENLSQEHNFPDEAYNKSIEYYLRLANLDAILNEACSQKNNFTPESSFISKKMFLSSRQLLNIIQNEYHSSLKKFNHENRIRLAKFFLENFPEMTVSHIARSCGYSSPETLSIIFKKHYGVAPSYFLNLKNQNTKHKNKIKI